MKRKIGLILLVFFAVTCCGSERGMDKIRIIGSEVKDYSSPHYTLIHTRLINGHSEAPAHLAKRIYLVHFWRLGGFWQAADEESLPFVFDKYGGQSSWTDGKAFIRLYSSALSGQSNITGEYWVIGLSNEDNTQYDWGIVRIIERSPDEPISLVLDIARAKIVHGSLESHFPATPIKKQEKIFLSVN